MSKRCSICGVVKEDHEFSPRPSTKCGLQSHCKACHNARQRDTYHNGGADAKRAYYVEHREEKLPKMRGKSGPNRGYDSAKGPAHRAVQRALARGALVRSPRCEECGAETQTEAHHHHGYDKTHYLDVVWLCRDCHNRADHPRFAAAFTMRENSNARI